MRGPCLCGAADCERCFPGQEEMKAERGQLLSNLEDAYDDVFNALESMQHAHTELCESLGESVPQEYQKVSHLLERLWKRAEALEGR